MRINSVRLQNFRQHVDTFIEFDTGLTGITGANGTGKSTILEAIAWALYGNPAARGKRESIRSLRAPARASVRVELDFELAGHRYTVVRGLTGAELFLDRGPAPIANSISGVSDVLRRRLGMTLEEFFNTYFTGQKELSVMAAMGPTERGQFLSRLLGYERLRVAQELARERRRAIVAEIAGVKTGMPDPDVVRQASLEAAEQLSLAEALLTAALARREAAATSVASVAPEWQAVQEERARVERIDSDRRVAESEQAARQRELERLDREVSELAESQSELSTLRVAIEPLAALRFELEALDRLAREEGKRQTLVARERELINELVNLEDRRKQIEGAPRLARQHATEVKRLRAELEVVDRALESARTEWVRARQEATTKIEQLKQNLADEKQQRDLLMKQGEDGTCPICERPLGDHYRTVLESIDEQIATITENGRYFRSRVNQLATIPPEIAEAEDRKKAAAETIAKLEKQLVRLQAEVQELGAVDLGLVDRDAKLVALRREISEIPEGYSAERHIAVRSRCDELQVLESRAMKLTGALERETQLRAERDRVVAALGVIDVRLTDLAAERAKAPDLEARFESVRAAHDSAVAQQRAAEIETAAAHARRAGAMAAAEAATRAVVDLERAIARLDELNQERRLHEELDREYAETRTDLNVQLRPEISERASILLSELTDGRYSELQLDESYDIVVIEDGIPKHVISGGEEDLANLVLRLSISLMLAERAGQPLSLLIFDEVFGSLDETRRENVVGLLHGLRDRFEQVIVITHVDLPSGHLDHHIAVSYDAESGASRVLQEDPPRFFAPDEREMGAAD